MARREARSRARAALVIAIDGPAAAGKGTLARRLAAHFGLNHLDSGALYRAVARDLLARGERADDARAALAAARALDAATLEDPALRTEEVARAASVVAEIPVLRQALLDFQRGFAATPPGAVIDGRDIGTVVCPEAKVKIFLDADVSARAKRRLKELQGRGRAGIQSRVLQEMEDRDRRDRQRQVSPLAPAPDAFRIDTTDLDADAVFEAARSFVEEKLAASPEPRAPRAL